MEGHLNKEKALDYKNGLQVIARREMLPKVFLSKKGMTEYNPSNYIFRWL